MWSKQKQDISEAYDALVLTGFINPDNTPKDDYMYEAWHNWSRHNPESYFRNERDDAIIYINYVAMTILIHSGMDSYSERRIKELSEEIYR